MLNTVSLFSGCGGLDLGLKKVGFNIIWAIDNDKFAVKSYKHNVSKHIQNADIVDIIPSDIPNHELLVAGFPCQPFSMMGKKRGFEDERGTLFFYIEKILMEKSPDIILLENVRNLLTHDKGRTFKHMKNILEEKLGYKIYHNILNSSDYEVPQTRNRVFIVGFKDHDIEFSFPKPRILKYTMQDLLDDDVDEKYFLSEKILKTILSTGTKNFKANPEIDLKVARPLCATMHKMHRAFQDNYVTDKGRVRRLTPQECAKLQGFPTMDFNPFGFEKNYEIVVSDTQAYRQFGNAVTVNTAIYLGEMIRNAVIPEKKRRAV